MSCQILFVRTSVVMMSEKKYLGEVTVAIATKTHGKDGRIITSQCIFNHWNSNSPKNIPLLGLLVENAIELKSIGCFGIVHDGIFLLWNLKQNSIHIDVISLNVAGGIARGTDA
jgi:hypothetical protein